MREERKQKREDPCGNNEQLNCNCTATGFALPRVEQQRVKREERRGKRSPKKPPEIHKLIDSKVCWPQGRLESRGRLRGLRHLPFGASVGAGSSPDGGRIGSTGAAARSEGWSVPSDGEPRGEIQERNEGAALGQHRHLRGPEEQDEEGTTHSHAPEGN